jgi:hypothetical protein
MDKFEFNLQARVRGGDQVPWKLVLLALIGVIILLLACISPELAHELLKLIGSQLMP